MTSIKSEFLKSEFNYDRTFLIYDELPYKNEFIIEPNELSYYRTFNIKLSYLYDNLLYIYSRCFIPNYKIPIKYTGFIGVTGNSLGIYQDTSVSNNFSFGGFLNLDFAKNAVVYKKDNSYYFFINCLSAINVLRYNGETNLCQACPNIITTVDPISGELLFQKINTISILNNKDLCLSDEKLDIVYKYDLETYFSDENVFKSPTAPFGNRLFLKDSLGGEGGRYNPIKFETPKNITSFDDLILVEDSGNKTFKLYNSNFNFLSYKTFISLYNTISSFKTIKFKDKNKIYGIVENGYYTFDLNLENYQITFNSFQTLSSVLFENEKVLDLQFSNYEKDIVYVLTDKSIIKKWEYVKDNIIGRKRVIDFGIGSEFKWFSTISKTTSSDLIHIYTYNSTASSNQILIYEDSLDLFGIFENNDFDIYSKDEIFVKKQEWNQAWIYEKSLKKMAKNVDMLKNNIYYNLIRNEDEFGNIIDLKKIYNKFIFNLTPTDYNRNFVVAVNEYFQSSVINRELSKIYDFEKNLLDFILLENNLSYEENINPPIFIPPPPPSPTPTFMPIGDGIVTLINNYQIKRFDGQDIYPLSNSAPILTPTPTPTPMPIGNGMFTFDVLQIQSFEDDDIYAF